MSRRTDIVRRVVDLYNQLPNDAGAIFTFGEEKIVRVDHFTDRESARRAFEADYC